SNSPSSSPVSTVRRPLSIGASAPVGKKGGVPSSSASSKVIDQASKDVFEETVKEGYLMKQGNNIRHDWRRRWCVLKGTTLYYYKNQNVRTFLSTHTICV